MRRILKPLDTALIVAIAAALCLLVNVDVTRAHPDKGCESCHVPHNAAEDTSVPLWNPDHFEDTILTDNYDSPTLQADMSGGITGPSKLCLSCHDGTYHAVADHATISSLATSHPVSFVYDEALVLADQEARPNDFQGLKMPDELDAGVLARDGKMHCTSCHDVHASAPAEPDLRWAYQNNWATGETDINANFCRNCHNQ